jgi:hypothetical protein
MTIQERVAAGIKLLGDERCRKLNIEKLDVADLQWCPIGQSFGGHFTDGLIALGIPEGEIQHGFEEKRGKDEYVALTEEWKRQLKELYPNG